MKNELQIVLNNATNNCPFYRNVNGQLDNYPTIEGRSYIELNNKFISKNYNNKNIKLLHYYYSINKEGYILKYLWNSNEIIKTNRHVWEKRKRYYGIKIDDKCICFHDYQPNGRSLLINNNYVFYDNVLSFSKGIFCFNDIEESISLIEMFKPDWMSIPSSFLVLLVEKMRSKNTKTFRRIKCIEYYGWPIHPELIKEFENLLCCKIRYYWGVEYNGLAYENPDNRLSIINNNAVLEGINHTIYVTSLNHDSCPIIRHNTYFNGKVNRGFIEINEEEYQKPTKSECLIYELIYYVVLKINRIVFHSIYKANYAFITGSLFLELEINNDFISWGEKIKKYIFDEINKSDIIDGIKIDIVLKPIMI